MIAQQDQHLRTRIIDWAYEIKAWDIKWCTGIYPGEMAAFLGLCDVCGVRSIIESGRGEDAYSTQVLGEYAERSGAKIVSIDLNSIQGKAFQERLSYYGNLRCVVGDAFEVFPNAAIGMPRPIAVLLDGPKLHPANRLSLAASIIFDIQIIAHHNCPLSSAWGKEFAKLFPAAFHYQDLGLSANPRWQEFKRWENGWVGGYEVYDTVHGTRGRSLDASSLAMAVLSANQRSRKRLFTPLRGRPKYNPLWLWLRWSLRRRKSPQR